jgi:hypothetical protein
MVTKIHGQPISHDLTILEKEMIAILANIPTTLGGGNYGHIGIIIEPLDYSVMSGGIDFVDLINPDFYPATLAMNAAAGTRAKAEAEHKKLINQVKTFEGVLLGTKDLILEAVANEYIIKIEHETLGFLKQNTKKNARALIQQERSTRLADTKNLLAKRDGEWNVNKNPQFYFNRVEKVIKSLA